MWILLALLVAAGIVAAVVLPRRRRAALALAERRGAWQRTAQVEVSATRALALELAAVRRPPVASAAAMATLRERAETEAVRLDQLAQAATSPEDATAAREAAAALRGATLSVQADLMLRAPGQAPTAEQLGAADASVRRADAELAAALAAIEGRSTPGSP